MLFEANRSFRVLDGGLHTCFRNVACRDHYKIEVLQVEQDEFPHGQLDLYREG